MSYLQHNKEKELRQKCPIYQINRNLIDNKSCILNYILNHTLNPTTYIQIMFHLFIKCLIMKQMSTIVTNMCQTCLKIAHMKTNIWLINKWFVSVYLECYYKPYPTKRIIIL